MNGVADWVSAHVWWVTGLSVVIVAAGLLGAAVAVVRMPSDYFVRRQPSPPGGSANAMIRLLRTLLRNVVGIVLVLVGLILSLPLIPGPGLLLVLIGLSLTDFPGKRRLELWIVRTPAVLRPLNRLRTAFGRPPLQG